MGKNHFKEYKFYFISGIYKHLWKGWLLLVKESTKIQQCILFHVPFTRII